MISPHFRSTLAQARVDDLGRTAATSGRARRHAHPDAAHANVTLRFGTRADAKRLARLAALDSARPLAPPVLLAEVDGQLVAALAISDGSVVADPFHPTADLIELLRARARHLEAKTQRTRAGRLRSWSRVRIPAWR